jgi:superfamily II DNA or RNA helicase
MVAVQITGERMQVHFDDFSAESYPLFLRVKSLPEYDLEFVAESETYRITAPARFASMLGIVDSSFKAPPLPVASFLFDDQAAIVDLAMKAKRFAIWSDCGLGKTPMGLELARQVANKTGGRVLIFTLNDIVPQWVEECRKFYGDDFAIHRLASREDMKAWAAGERPDLGNVAITNYEKMNYKGEDEQSVSELRYLAGVVLDESSRLKAGGGKQKWALIKSCKGIEYKFSLTATPAPNDTMEFASQASFLEKMRSDGEIIWTFFQRNEKTHRWEVKRHARKAFFEFMAGWSIYVRDPRRYGWRKDFPDIPPPVTLRTRIDMTDDQRAWLQKLSRDKSGQLSLIDRDDRNAIQRSKLSQVAKGFVYLKGKSGRKTRRIQSRKPEVVANLIKQEAAAGLQVLVWTVFDAESDIIAETLGTDTPFEMLHGETKPAERLQVLERFRHGQTRVLISKAELLGFGMNFQMCGSMIFSGFDDSYESFYQAIRRAYRYGQTKSVRVHLPVIEELEGDMLENLFIKQAKHEAAIAEMEANYIAATHSVGAL